MNFQILIDENHVKLNDDVESVVEDAASIALMISREGIIEQSTSGCNVCKKGRNHTKTEESSTRFLYTSFEYCVVCCFGLY